jgi:serine/threonine protein kinase
MLPTHLKPGMVFGQDYEILEKLAQGGMGTVYVALQQSTGKRRAVKVMHAQYEGDDSARRRFIQEARAGAAIDSDHLVEMVGAGIDADTNTPWIAMELLKGADLKAVMAERRRLPPGEVLEIFRQVCHALGRAHKMGLVHRDLKPENIFLAVPRREGVAFTAKILDFGIAKLLRENTGNSTQTQAIGSPRWMSPEQADRGGAIAASTDVWALGLIAFYLLTGEIYWKTAHLEAPSVIGQMCEILMDPIAPASERAAEFSADRYLPDGFDGWFERCVHRDQAHRFADADEALAAFEDVMGDAEPVPVAAVQRRSTPARGVSTRPPSPATPTPPTPPATAPLRGSTAPRGYSLEVPAPKDDQPFAFDATMVGDTSAPQPVSLPPPDDTQPRTFGRRVGPLALAVLGPVGIAVAVFLGIKRPHAVDAERPATAARDAALVVADGAPVAAAPDVSVVTPPDAAAVVEAAPDATALPEVAVLVQVHDAATHPREAAVALRADARVARPHGAEPETTADAATVESPSVDYTRAVAGVMRRQHPTFIQCYQDHAPPGGNVRVSIRLHYSINADGSPSAVSVNGAPDEVNSCIADAIRAVRFPTPVVVSGPIFDELHFSSQ